MSTPALLDLPSAVSAGRVRTSRGEFAVLTAGSGPLVVLVPGWTGSKEDFLSVLAPLAALGYRVVSLDLRGQYETAGVSDPSAYSIDALADDLSAVIDAFDESTADVVGHSFGGLVSRSLALRRPDALRSLTLLCSGPSALPASRHALLQLMVDAIDTHGLERTWQAKRAYERSQGLTVPAPRVEAFLRRRFLANHPVALREMTRHLMTAPDRTAELAAAPIPILVAYGEHDDGWPVQVQAGMAAVLGSVGVAIPEAAHSPAVEQPATTTTLLARFWARSRAESVPPAAVMSES